MYTGSVIRRTSMAEVKEPPVPLVGKRRDSPVAPLDRCIAEVEALGDTDLRKLRNFARLRLSTIRGFFHLPGDDDDLVHEAIVRTYDGRRKWRPEEVDFLQHLFGCIRSIASEWKKKAYAEMKAAQLAQQPETTPEYNPYNPFWPSKILDDTRARLEGNAMPLQVFDLLREGKSRAEILGILKINANVYDAARKMIRRRINEKFEEFRSERW